MFSRVSHESINIVEQVSSEMMLWELDLWMVQMDLRSVDAGKQQKHFHGFIHGVINYLYMSHKTVSDGPIPEAPSNPVIDMIDILSLHHDVYRL